MKRKKRGAGGAGKLEDKRTIGGRKSWERKGV